MRPFADLPVAVDLPAPLAHEVTAFVEAEAGWQVVAAQGPLAPALTLTSAPRPGGRCVVVAAGAPPVDDIRAALLAGAVDVIAWPQERQRLLEAPARLAREAVVSGGPAVLRVGGTRGGVGCSTVALTIAACVAWSGRRALVVCDQDALALAGVADWEGAGTVELSALGAQAAEEVGGVVRPVPGVDGLSLLGGGRQLGAVDGWPFDLVVVDAGVAIGSVDVVVGAADAAVAAAPQTSALLVVDHGPLDRAGVRRRLGRAPAGWLPYSVRVARAGLAGRVPSALPGSWVKAVRAGLRGAVR